MPTRNPNSAKSLSLAAVATSAFDSTPSFRPGSTGSRPIFFSSRCGRQRSNQPVGSQSSDETFSSWEPGPFRRLRHACPESTREFKMEKQTCI